MTETAENVEITVRIELVPERAVGEALVSLCQRHGATLDEVIDYSEGAPALYLAMTGASREDLESDVDVATRWDSAVTAWEVL